MTPTLLLGADAAARLRVHARAVALELQRIVSEEVDDPAMRDALDYHLGYVDDHLEPSSGHRLDGLAGSVALLGYQAATAEPRRGGVDRLVPLAAALELLRGAAVVHEEILGGIVLRETRPALWTVSGRPRALEAAACLHALAFRCLGRLREGAVDVERLLDVMSAVAQASVALAVGQSRALTFATGPDPDPGRYLEGVAHGSALLWACAAASGSLLAIGSEEGLQGVVACYWEFGLHLGVALRIADDVMGTWGVDLDSWRPSGSDIRRRKRTLPVAYALAHAAEHDRRVLASLYSLTTCLSFDEEAVVRGVLARCGVAGSVVAEAEVRCRRARSALARAAGGPEHLEANPFLAALAEVAGAVASRSAALTATAD